MDLRSAIQKINRRGMLLIFPINNKKEPASLWYEFFPRTEMRWEWDEHGDSRVGDLWHLRERLSVSRKVVYTKWFRGRATAISFELFCAMLRCLHADLENARGSLSFQAREVLDVLEEDSPLSTKALKRATDLAGRENERVYERTLKELWSKMLVVGFGEVDEGAFPSLAIGATRVIFEDCWRESQELSMDDARATVEKFLAKGTPFRKYFDSLTKDATIE